MKIYKENITLNKNARGCYILDTIKGCSGGALNNNTGCYGECYAMKIASRYGFNFLKPVNRKINQDKSQFYLFGFKDEKESTKVIKQIKKIDMPFIRIGEMCDPSEDWEHTIEICNIISKAKKPIVIITKHWKTIPYHLLQKIEKLNICINTSISALDTEEQIHHRLHQFYKLKSYCKSILRIVSCDFNKKNEEGLILSIIQKELFSHTPNIDTIFRPSTKNDLVVNNIINVEKVKFLKSKVIASKYNKNTYFGLCDNCPDMCGINF